MCKIHHKQEEDQEYNNIQEHGPETTSFRTFEGMEPFGAAEDQHDQQHDGYGAQIEPEAKEKGATEVCYRITLFIEEQVEGEAHHRKHDQQHKACP